MMQLLYKQLNINKVTDKRFAFGFVFTIFIYIFVGGTVVENDTEEPCCYTHLIYRADNKTVATLGGFSEELMVCMASGKYGLTVRYLEKSLSSGCFRQDLRKGGKNMKSHSNFFCDNIS